MSVYYLNAAGATPNGLTPGTGFHSLSDLLAYPITLVDDDIVYLVSVGGTIDDSGAEITLTNVHISFFSYSGNASKPTWKLRPSETSFNINLNSSTKSFNIKDILFTATSLAIINVLNSDPTKIVTTSVERCHFDTTIINTTSIHHFSVLNNIFQVTGANSVILNSDDTYRATSVNVCNNTFYNNTNSAIKLIGTYDSFKILNNIFDTLGQAVEDGAGFHGGGFHTFPDLEIDYNITHDITNPDVYSPELNPFLGAHNISATDPMFTTPGSDFTLQVGSPAINAGVGHWTEGAHPGEPSVPMEDYLNNARPFDTYTDMGAYEKGSTSPTEPIPNFLNGTPTLNNVTDKNVAFDVEIDVDFGTAILEICLAGKLEPNTEQVRDTVDGNNDPGVDGSNSILEANVPGILECNLDALTPGTNYDAYFITGNVDDTAWSSPPIKISFTTTGATTTTSAPTTTTSAPTTTTSAPTTTTSAPTTTTTTTTVAPTTPAPIPEHFGNRDWDRSRPQFRQANPNRGFRHKVFTNPRNGEKVKEQYQDHD